MKEFKLHVGLHEDNMTEVLHSGLKNDPAVETFNIRSVNQAGLAFPTRYVKIEPLSAHGQSFHTSIWYVALNGIVDERYVAEVKAKHEEFQETIMLRHVLKHLRQRRLLGPFQSLLDRSGIQLEHPLVTALHTTLVIKGDFAECERLLSSMASSGLLTSSLLSQQPQAQWTRLNAVDADGDSPSARSGHAMCMDHDNGQIYLFGGWDGQKNLDDFWVFDVRSETWTLISYATQRDANGPGPRSCHKMVFDSTTGDIYVFGRLDDGNAGDIGEITAGSIHTSGVDAPATSPVSPRQATPPTLLDSSRSSAWSNHGAQFYRYRTRGRDAGKWELLFRDTSAAGGPPVVFDHQMAIDPEAQVIYVSGGRVVDGDWESLKFSGLYSYDIRRNRWKMCQSPESSAAYPSIPSRYGHSMVFDKNMQTLFIFGGQRDDKYLSDMYAYHVPSNTVTELFSNFTSVGGPDACFTQRAVLDADLGEIYVFCGLTRSRHHTDIVLESDSPYWIYRYERPERPGRWTKIVPAESSSSSTAIPLARYAHQVVYDPLTKTSYMHGGNACLEPHSDDGQARLSSVRATANNGNRGASEERIEDVGVMRGKERLDDFWKMTLLRPSPDDVIRRGKYLIRQQQFCELCNDSTPIKALSYLKTEVSAVVDHSDAEETKSFRALLAHLLSPQAPPTRKRSREDDSPAPSARSLDTDEPMADAPAVSSPDCKSVVSLQEDAEEQKLERARPASPEQYRQRTEVFEHLMAFVNADAKQPDKDLIRLINVDSADVY